MILLLIVAVRKANTTHLKPSIKGSLNSNTFCGMRSIRCDGSDQAKKIQF